MIRKVNIGLLLALAALLITLLFTFGIQSVFIFGTLPSVIVLWAVNMLQRDYGSGGIPRTLAKEKRLRRARRRSRSYKEDE
ncbi:hypothetical protein MNBD_ALPHA06-1518 [hydrothermal vent metagenome]|uniref:Uncharacterized protein n=1 Tax=hydrothermal vent metagenome TaxID=652676 RepID=A0A3B0RTC4_9ZZZZ